MYFPTLFQAGIRACKFWSAAFPWSSQWHVGRPALAYRCGGSTGFAPVSRL